MARAAGGPGGTEEGGEVGQTNKILTREILAAIQLDHLSQGNATGILPRMVLGNVIDTETATEPETKYRRPLMMYSADLYYTGNGEQLAMSRPA